MFRVNNYSKYGVLFSIAIIGSSFMILNADGESNVIPNWIKNTAQWWSQDQISETEYIATLQYLIDNEIIAVDFPINSVLATNVAIPNEQRAQSFEVTVESRQYNFEETFYTFVQFINRNEASGQPSGVLSSLPKNPEFLLGSLPSSDKMILYEHIERTLEPGAQIDLLELDVHVSVLSGDGKVMQIWEYEECSLADYVAFLNFDKEEFRWSGEEDSEIRELFFFECRGIDFSASTS